MCLDHYIALLIWKEIHNSTHLAYYVHKSGIKRLIVVI